MSEKKRSLRNIVQEYLDVVEELEENGGDISEETESLLIVNRDDFMAKVDAYCDIIAEKENDYKFVVDEIKRLTDLKKFKEKTADTLKTVLLDALKVYGNIDAKGIARIETTLHRLSTRKSDSTVIKDEENLKRAITTSIFGNVSFKEREVVYAVAADANDLKYLDIDFDFSDTSNDVPITEIVLQLKQTTLDLFDNENKPLTGEVAEVDYEEPAPKDHSKPNQVEIDFLVNQLTYNAKLHIKYGDMLKVADYIVNVLGYSTRDIDIDVSIPKKQASEVIKNEKGFRIASTQTKHSLVIK